MAAAGVQRQAFSLVLDLDEPWLGGGFRPTAPKLFCVNRRISETPRLLQGQGSSKKGFGLGSFVLVSCGLQWSGLLFEYTPIVTSSTDRLDQTHSTDRPG